MPVVRFPGGLGVPLDPPLNHLHDLAHTPQECPVSARPHAGFCGFKDGRDTAPPAEAPALTWWREQAQSTLGCSVNIHAGGGAL